MNELALFAGAGGGILGGTLLGWDTVAAVEIEDYPRAVLLQRQLDGILPQFPVWDDIKTFDGRPWRGKVDIVSGGFPCQDISAAGKGEGIEGSRSGLWSEMARVVGEVRPRFVFVENSPLLTSRGLGRVLGDLSQMGFNAEWAVLGAHHTGAPHKRDRIWILANSNKIGWNGRPGDKRTPGRRESTDSGEIPDTSGQRLQGSQQPGTLRDKRNREEAHGSISECNSISRPSWWGIDPAELSDADSLDGQHGGHGTSANGRELQQATIVQERRKWPVESRVGRVAHGVAHRVDRLKAIGNGQVPAVAALAFITLYNRIGI